MPTAAPRLSRIIDGGGRQRNLLDRALQPGQVEHLVGRIQAAGPAGGGRRGVASPSLVLKFGTRVGYQLVPGVTGPCGARQPGPSYVACAYSWIEPLRTGRRWIFTAGWLGGGWAGLGGC
jgi:hypothetical protein